MTSLNEMSDNISCDHIKQLNESYNTYNDRLFKEKFICFNNDDSNNDDINKNKDIKYLNNIYVSRKSCIYKSTEPDEFKWTNSYVNSDIMNTITNDYKNDYKNYNDKVNVLFNENTRRKILTNY